ncbi:MAG: phage terminase, large subunit [Rhizorhabdus sp.]|nr:phage terminase, large subunit [Rhizorhabdus sp.]
MNVERRATRLAHRAEANASLYFFTRHGFRQQQNRRWLHNWHHETVCARLQEVFDGRCRRLIINIPPRYAKTEIAVISFMAWALGRQPDAEFIHTSYASRLAVSNSMRCRDMVQSDWYAKLFPKTKVAAGSAAKDDWRTTAGGVVYATGAGGSITGYGAGKKREQPGFGGAIIIDELQRVAPFSPALKQARDLLRDAFPIPLDLPNDMAGLIEVVEEVVPSR